MNLGFNPDLSCPHNLRHLRVTELYKSRKFTELEMMKWFGWRTRTMIDVYSKITMNDVEKKVRELYRIEKLSEEVKFCPKCGLRVNFEAKYCPRCGTKLDVEELQKDMMGDKEKLEGCLSYLRGKLGMTLSL